MAEKSELRTGGPDCFDLAILDILQRDNKTPQRAIAEAVGLSAPAVQRRIRRMEATGTIVANVAIVDPSSVRREITVFVEVEMDSELGHMHDQAKRAFSEAPEVQQCYYVTGEVDFILIITVGTMSDYEALSRQLFFGNNNVKRFRSFIAMDRVKTGLSVPVLDVPATDGGPGD
ncbi:Lrp/AsnC family transcriptional regulator [Bradyrhizobium sp. LMG 9283]|uniref:Lrp/AsnC family transcriptional regulator n=1 Tax=Bradyrhizobium sp. LMG 9283 TaxID=592064 RepID=UPI00388E7652